MSTTHLNLYLLCWGAVIPAVTGQQATSLPLHNNGGALESTADSFTMYTWLFCLCGRTMQLLRWCMTKEFAQIFLRDNLSKHGLPLKIVSDRGTQFTSKVSEICSKAVGR